MPKHYQGKEVTKGPPLSEGICGALTDIFSTPADRHMDHVCTNAASNSFCLEIMAMVPKLKPRVSTKPHVLNVVQEVAQKPSGLIKSCQTGPSTTLSTTHLALEAEGQAHEGEKKLSR